MAPRQRIVASQSSRDTMKPRLQERRQLDDVWVACHPTLDRNCLGFATSGSRLGGALYQPGCLLQPDRAGSSRGYRPGSTAISGTISQRLAPGPISTLVEYSWLGLRAVRRLSRLSSSFVA